MGELGAGAGQELAGFGPTAIGAWGRPAHRRLKEQRLLLLNAPQQRPATIPQAEHDRAASARDLEVDVLGTHTGDVSCVRALLLILFSCRWRFLWGYLRWGGPRRETPAWITPPFLYQRYVCAT